MSQEGLPCVVCGKPLLNVFDDLDNQPSEGLAFSSHGHYGSTAFDPMDGQRLELNICDPCLLSARDKGQVFVGRDRRPVVTDDEHGRVIVGWQRTDPHLTLWRAGLGEHDEEDVFLVEPGKVGTEVDRVTWTPGGLAYQEPS